MRKSDSQHSLPITGSSRANRLLMESTSSDETPETERLLSGHMSPVLVAASGHHRRQSLTAPPSPTELRKKQHRHHNYMNHFQQLIHWRDKWGGEQNRGHESLHRSESMLSLACFRTLAQLINNEDTTELQQYLANNKNINVDDRDENGTTAVMLACENNRLAAARLLLAAGADPAAADADDWTPLAFAARGGHLAVVKLLLDAGAYVEPKDCGGWTPLMWASYKGHEEIVALLLEKGADVHAHGNYNINSLVWAAGRKHSGVVQLLLAAGARANSCDKYGTSALTWAARCGDVTSTAALLKASADPNTAGMYCWTPLLQATHGNHFEIVQMLLEHKPNVNALDKDGYTALAIACKEGYYDIASVLINSGAYINVQDHSKDTPLIHAVKGGHKSIVEALIKKHVDVDLPGKEKKTPVYTAVEKGHNAILKLLLASNPDLELSTTSGDTPLLRAVRSRNAEMVQLLLEKKARVNAVDKRGDTALHIAIRARSKQIVEILLRNPKNSQLLYKPNKLNETPYNLDMSYNKTILGQIFGARKLNTNEDNENMLGYELYAAALADMLSEPSLAGPITVGLFARWGSGKSFLLNKLKEEMCNFARVWTETGWAWSWAVWWGAWRGGLVIGALSAMLVPPLVAAGIAVGIALATYLALYLLWVLGNKYESWWAGGVLSALGRRFNSLLLLLQVIFCHPPGSNDPRALPATPIRFHFTEGMKSGAGGQESEAVVVHMIGSLAEAIECQYGRVCTRLARAFKPNPVSTTSGWRWRRVCCIPHIVTFEVCFIGILIGLCTLFQYLTEADAETAYESRRAVQQGLMIGASVIAAVVLVANLYTWGRVASCLLLGPRARLARAVKREAPTLALRPEVHALTHMVSCLDAFTGQQTRLVVVVDALDSCEQDKVLALLNAVHALCSDPGSPFILLLAIDPHIISKAVEVNSRRAFSESNIGGWDYLRNIVQLPFYLQNSALRRVKVAQQAATRRAQAMPCDDISASLQRSVSARRLSSTSEVMSSQERIKGQSVKEQNNTAAAARARRLRPSESVASSIASGLHRAGAPTTGAADLNRVLLTDDYFSDVNPRSMRRLMNVLYITGRLLKAFQIEFNWYQLASWVNLTEQWPFRTSWIIYHHETFEEHIEDTTSLKHIYDKVKPLMTNLREASTLMELDRDERKLEVFLSFHRSTLTAADLKIFLPFTINLDPYVKKVIKEEQLQSYPEEESGAGAAASLLPWGPQPSSVARQPHNKLVHRKLRSSSPNNPSSSSAANAPPLWLGWANTGSGFMPQSGPPPPQFAQPSPPKPHPQQNPYQMLKNMFPNLGDVSHIRLSTLSVERVCSLAEAALGGSGGGGGAVAAKLREHRLCGAVLAHCHLPDCREVLGLPFGDWEMFKMLILNLREIENNAPLNAPAVNVIPEKLQESETDSIKRPIIEHQPRSRPSNVEKQVTLEEQMICGALQTLNEEALEDVLQSEPPETAADEESTLQLSAGAGGTGGGGGGGGCLLKAGSIRRRPVTDPHPPIVTFNVENEEDSDDSQITFTAHAPRSHTLTVEAPAHTAYTIEEQSYSNAVSPPLLDLILRNLKRNDVMRKVNSSERLSRLKERIMSSPVRSNTAVEGVESEEWTPLVGGARSPQQPDLDLLPESKWGGGERRRSSSDLAAASEPFSMRVLSRGASDMSRLSRQDALDAPPPWQYDDPDSAV